MRLDHTPTAALSEEAAHWLVELEEPGTEVLGRFAAWLESSPRHIEEFLMAAAVWKEFDHFDAERRLDIEQLLATARSNVRPLGASATTEPVARGRWRPTRVAVLAGIAAAAVLGLALWLYAGGSPQTYATTRGEQRALKLEDGSVVYLNTQSRVEVMYSKTARTIRLLEGEAMFNVEQDAIRPFRVMSGPAVIQAIGTRFNVYRSDAGATVTVVEGVVQISPNTSAASRPTVASRAGEPQGAPTGVLSGPERLAAGEQARVSPRGEVVKRSVADLTQVVAWRERRLVFRGDSLDDVATEFNRYNTLQIHVEGAAVAAKQITGVFDADDPRSLLQFLERDPALAVIDDGQNVAVRER
ncbi:MAG TPA: FecR domain-containing protein [Steroidobacteraceae bacterium]|jgi:transmembrane sensor|nr:FecR domain-containing protein [Steroidobacteraceae bacterium]